MATTTNVDPYLELFEIQKRYRICVGGELNIISYSYCKSILQIGPQCGLVALAMCMPFESTYSVADIYSDACSRGMTKNGEMFNTYSLAKLSEFYVSCDKVEVYEGNLMSSVIVNFLAEGGLILVPYDADCNHYPCLKKGHKAHWAVVCGLLKCDNFTYVPVRHGKSQRLDIWPLEHLAMSNSQLIEFCPNRKNSGLTYILPEGGISGKYGLKDKCILLHNVKK